MTKLNIILIIINSLVLLSLISHMVYKYNYEKLSNTKEKLNDAESEFLEKFKIKYDLIIKMIDYTLSKYKVESKSFDDAREINIESSDSYKNEKLLNKCYKEIIQIKDDNLKVRETKAFKEMIKEYNDNEINIISLRTYHNKYTIVYNNMIKKFPCNIVSKIKKFTMSELIEGTELDSEFNNDMEV